jgi:putative cell wall-binding protein
MARKVLRALIALSLLQALVVLPAAAQEAGSVTVDIVDFLFLPEHVQIPVGATVTWDNKDPGPHTATDVDGEWSVALQAFESGSHTFSEEGSFDYFCKLHPEMVGTVQVGEADGPPFPEPTFARLDAADNVGAAIAFSQQAFDDGGSRYALLGRDDLFADSLSSGGAQGALDAPLLLTSRTSLDARVRSELQRLGTRTVFVLGGPAAISQDVLTALRAAGFGATRVAGDNRAGTAVAVAQRFYSRASSAIVARGFGASPTDTRAFADSLGAGAAAAATGQPLLLTATDRLSPETRSYLSDHAIDEVIVAGGPAAVSDAVVAEMEALGIEVMRAAGENRNGTAAELAMLTAGPSQPAMLVLVDGASPDSWASGFPAAALQSPVLLTAGDDIPPQTTALLLSALMNGMSVVCGPSASSAACAKAETIAGADGFGGPRWRVAMLEAAEGVSGNYSGLAEVMGTPDSRALCAALEIFALSGEATAAHIHQVSDGAPVVPLQLEPGPFGMAVTCAFGLNASLVSDIIDNPRSYYVNIHTAAAPGGEITGTLFTPQAFAIADMIGEFEVPGPGDPRAAGFTFLVGTDDPTELCTYMGVFELDPPATAAHVHEGGPTETGPPVVTLPLPNPQGAPFVTGCQAGLDEQLVADILAAADTHYVNVHNQPYPDGAIRGQVFNPFGPPPGEGGAEAQGDVSAAGVRPDLSELSPTYERWTR